MSSTRKEPRGSRSAGPAWAALGLLVLLLARGIDPIGLGDNHDPGPRAFPVGLGIVLVAGGLLDCLLDWRTRRRHAAGPGSEDGAAAETLGPAASARPDRPRREVLVLLLGLGLYLPSISWLGFSLSTLLFSGAVLRWLGGSWKLAIVTSLALVAGVHLLFVEMFKVQLPGGIWAWTL